MQKLLGKMILAIYVLAMFFAVPQLVKAWPGAYATWTTQQLIAFNAPTPVNDYQVAIYLDSTFNYAGANSDGSDIRFADISDNILNYYIEKWNDYGDSILWVKVPTSGTSQIYMYYGKSGASSESNGKNVFVLFDDFTGSSLDGAIWNQVITGSGTVTVGSGMADIYITKEYQTGTGIRTNNSYLYGNNTILEARASMDFDAVGSYGDFGYTYGNCTDWHVCFNDRDRTNNVALTSVNSSSYTASVPGDVNVWHKYKIVRENNKATWYRDGSLLSSVNDASFVPSLALNIYFGGETYSYGGMTPDRVKHHYLDWVRVRKFSTQEVYSGTFGPERRNTHAYDDWQYRRTIDLSTGTPETDHEIEINLNASNFDYSKANLDGSDLRFADPDIDALSYELHYWVESWNPGGNSRVWVKIPDQGTTSFYMYYGNNLAVSESNGKLVFELFDDFVGTTVDSTMWNKAIDCGLGGCSITVSGGLLDVYIPAEYQVYSFLQSKPWYQNYGANTILEGSASIDFGGVRNFGQFGFGGYENINFIDSGSNIGQINLVADNSVIDTVAGDVNIFHQYKLVRAGSHTVIWYIDGTQVGSYTDPGVFDGAEEIYFGGATYTFGGLMPDSAEHHYLDWIRLRQYNSTVVNVTLGGQGFNPNFVELVSINRDTNVSATVPSSLTFTINPVPSGTNVNGTTTNLATTTGNQVDFGSFAGADDKIAAHDLLVSTNATNGYQVIVKYDNHLASASDYIPDFTGTNTTPILWTAPPGSGTNGYFGYTTNDSSLYSSLNNRFVSNKWAGFYSDYAEVAYHDGVVENQSTRVGYRLQITSLQAAGNYSNHLVYLCTATY